MPSEDLGRLPQMGPLTSARGRVLLRLCGFAVAVAIERRRVARGKEKGLRRVDARTGAPLSLRQTILVLGVREAVQWLSRAIPRPRAASRWADPQLKRELVQVQTQHADDPRARQEAVMRLYQEHRVEPFRACLPAVARSAALIAVNRCPPVPFLSERRTLADLLAGTKLVRVAPSRWSRLRLRRTG